MVNENILQFKTIVEKLDLLRELRENEVDDDNIDEMLDMRNSKVFETDWVRVDDEIQLLKDKETMPNQVVIDQIREISFMKAIKVAGNEVAGYVSDDFELLALALCLKHSDPWLNALWIGYKSGSFPHNKLTPVDGNSENLLLHE